MIRRLIIFFLFLMAALLIRIGYLYNEVGKAIAPVTVESPTIFYGHPLEIRKGVHLGNIHFTERLHKLSYKKVPKKPTMAGTFSQDRAQIRLFLRHQESENPILRRGPVDISLKDGRVISLTAADGKELDFIRIEPEEIGRMAGAKAESRYTVTLSAISPHLQQAVIACEDKRFYSHFGIDILAIGRSLLADKRQQQFAQGASTITQQLAKNFFLTPQKTVMRKLREAELALALELRYTKKQILEMYLNIIYLGQTGSREIYGVEDAAGFYFSKRSRDLSLEEAALLAGIIHAPNRYKLSRNPQAAQERRNSVLSRMKKLAMISEEDLRRAINAPLRIHTGADPARLSSYFIDYIIRITKDELDTEKPYNTGYRYYTTLDPFLQAAAEEAVARGLEEIEKRALSAPEPLQAALVAVDPKTGWISAMVGGRSYSQTRFNRALDAKRQSGSAFKPFVLLAALTQSLKKHKNLTLSTTISGEPISLATPEGIWTPINFENKKYGMITIRQAIEDSVNTATVRMAQEVGFDEVVKTAREAGITSPLSPVPSLPLGSFEVTPVELAYAYAAIASGGIQFERFPLLSVTTADGDKIITRKVKSKKAFDSRITYLVGYALEGVLTRGTAKEAQALKINYPVAGKTGTTNGNRDSWFVSYTPDIVCAVWVGYDSGVDTGLTGAAGALRINARFLRTLYSKAQPLARIPPKGIETAVIDPQSGYLATALCPQRFPESYLTGTAPQETCPDHPENNFANKLRKKMRNAGQYLRDLF